MFKKKMRVDDTETLTRELAKAVKEAIEAAARADDATRAALEAAARSDSAAKSAIEAAANADSAVKAVIDRKARIKQKVEEDRRAKARAQTEANIRKLGLSRRRGLQLKARPNRPAISTKKTTATSESP